MQQALAALEKGNGFTGTIGSPTLATLQHLIRTGLVRTFLQSPTTTDPRLLWVAGNCLHITQRAPGQKSALPIAGYYCLG